MKPGDTVRLTHFQNWLPEMITTWKAPKGEVFVAVLIGTEKKEEIDTLNFVEAFANLGWIPEPGAWSEEALSALEGNPEK